MCFIVPSEQACSMDATQIAQKGGFFQRSTMRTERDKEDDATVCLRTREERWVLFTRLSIVDVLMLYFPDISDGLEGSSDTDLYPIYKGYGS
ncbi:hypothetical protein TNCV_4574171 [Trichonephila clavipes]|nr:hypothetical protein TNCV_4574171 [Trichonephila clavipes]